MAEFALAFDPNQGVIFQSSDKKTYTVSGKPAEQNGIAGTQLTIKASCTPKQ